MEYKITQPRSRKEWRLWLKKNHASSPGVWMAYFKKSSSKQTLTVAEAVEEALCFGWIDSTQRKLDEERAILTFTPRKPRSVWSQINKERIKRLIETGEMTEAGLAKINEAKKNGSWDSLNNSDHHTNNNSIPEDLAKAFNKNKKALENFKGFAPSYRKRFLSWIDSAKRPETREARVKQTVLMAAVNKKPDAKGFKL